MSANKTSFVQGETAIFTVADSGYSAVSLSYGSATASMTLANGVWSVSLSTATLSGAYNYAIFADGSVIDSGAFTVRVLASRYRAVVDAIDAAMAKVGANGKMSIVVGEIHLTDKTFDEMLKWRSYYAALAAGEEAGAEPNIGPWRTEVTLA